MVKNGMQTRLGYGLKWDADKKDRRSQKSYIYDHIIEKKEDEKGARMELGT